MRLFKHKKSRGLGGPRLAFYLIHQDGQAAVPVTTTTSTFTTLTTTANKLLFLKCWII